MGLNILEKLMSKIYITEVDCWEWLGGKNNVGYGMIRHGEKMRLAHRVSYEIYNDTVIPPDILIGHTCFNYRCVNPAHLYPATRQLVTQKMHEGKRYNTGVKRRGPFPKRKCVHCNREIPVNSYGLHHGDRCKMANVV